MSELKLLNCPFCGGEARYMEIKDFFISRFVTCTKCGIETPRNCLNRKDAIKRWNTRKPMDNIVEKLEEESKKKHNKERDVLCKIANASYSAGVKYAINIVKQEINNGLE